jgi:hypothetical protein
MNLINNSRKYLESFIRSHYQDYFEAMNEYRPQNGYGNFLNSSEIVQCMRNITHNFADEFSNLQIPENFATPKLLIETVNNFISLLKSYEPKFSATHDSYADIELLPVPVFEINKRRLETIEACEHFIKLANKELNSELETDYEMNNFEKITIDQILQLAKRLTIGSMITLLGILGMLICITFYGTRAIDGFKVRNLNEQVQILNNKQNDLSKDLVDKNLQIETLKKELTNKQSSSVEISKLKLHNDSLIELNNSNGQNIHELKNLLKNLQYKYDKLIKSPIQAEISSSKPTTIINGRIMISTHYIGPGSILEFTGIKGVDSNRNGNFNQFKLVVNKGDRFYLLDEDMELWTVSVINVGSPVRIEFFKTSPQNQHS